jgi:hypothetical protein
MGSRFIVGTRGAVMACWRVYLRMPCAPPKRAPMPDSYQPPWGSVPENRFA